MKKLKFLGILGALLLSGNAFAGAVYFVDCASCTPSNSNDPTVRQILTNWALSGLLRPGDIVSIMEQQKDPVTGEYPVTNWKWQNGSFLRYESGAAIQTSAPSGGGGGASTDGRTWVTVGQVLVMYPNPPTATVTVDGVYEGSAGGGGGGCTLHQSESTCASLDSVSPGGGTGGPQSQ